MQPHTSGRTAGFSLVEVALAILVVSVGLVAALGMFATGLQTNQNTIQDTQSALFANDVLNTMRALAADTNNWPISGDILSQARPSSSPPGGAGYDPTMTFNPDDTRYAYTTISGVTLQDYRYWYQLTPGTRTTLTVYNYYGSNAPTVFYTEFYNFGM